MATDKKKGLKSNKGNITSSVTPEPETPPKPDQQAVKTRIQSNTSDNDNTTILSPLGDKDSTDKTPTRLAEEKTILKETNLDKTKINLSSNASGNRVNRAGEPQTHNGLAESNLIDNRYERQEQLGEGGMGKVYKVIDRESSGDVFALKILSEEFSAHPDAVISLERECAKSRKLRHTNIVGVHHFAHARDTGEAYMLLEYLEGKPLNNYLSEYYGEGLPKAKALKILRGLCRGLEYAHSSLLVHSDLKPGNIFVTNDNTTKILDFGLARALSDENNIFDPSSLKGLTRAYASPEIENGELPAFGDDIYALGCVAYELFAGCHPFNGLSAKEAMAKGLKAPRLKSLNGRQWSALKSALSFSAEKRVVSVEVFSKRFFEKSKLLLAAAVGCAFLIPVGLSYLSQKKAQEVEIEALALTERNAVLQVQQQQARDASEKKEAELKQQMITERVVVIKGRIDTLLASPSASDEWALDISQELKEYRKSLPQGNTFEVEVKQQAALSTISLAKSKLTPPQATSTHIESAQELVLRAQSWSAQAEALASSDIAGSKWFKDNKQEIEKQQIEVEQLITTKQQALEAKESLAIKARIAQQISRVERSVFCRKSLNIKKVSENLQRLKRLSKQQEAKQRPIVAQHLVACILSVANSNLARATQLHKSALGVLPKQQSLLNLRVDRCAHLKPGAGARKNNFCRDKLLGGERGPSLVVIPLDGEHRLAISKYEITGKNIKIYCDAVGGCKGLTVTTGWLPAHQLSITQIQGYIDWLNQQSGYRYRLPTHNEWLIAASAGTRESDASRNCRLKYGAIIKGDVLNDANSGAANKHGLFNSIGNVRELAYSSTGELLAVGGSRKTAMNKCSSKTRMKHSGNADNLTGFRVVRGVGT